jgi:hypothetical protein
MCANHEPLLAKRGACRSATRFSVSPGHEQTQAWKKAYLTNEMRYRGVRGQPPALRCDIKQV